MSASGSLYAAVMKFKDEAIDNTMNEMIPKYERRIQSVHKSIMREILMKWYTESSGYSFYKAYWTMYRATYFPKVITHRYADKSAKITSHAWCDPFLYSPNTASAYRWLATHGGGMSPNEYIFNLQMYEGIIGLPETGSAPINVPEWKVWSNSGWVDDNGYWHNAHFHQNTPLDTVIQTSPLWDSFFDRIGI